MNNSYVKTATISFLFRQIERKLYANLFHNPSLYLPRKKINCTELISHLFLVRYFHRGSVFQVISCITENITLANCYRYHG